MEPADDEVFERIPWEQVRQSTQNRRGLIYAVAAAVVAAGLSAWLARGVVAVAPSPNVTPATSTPVTAPPPTASPTPETTAPVAWTEADLMAVHPEELRSEAAAVAEWFASSYFTADGTTSAIDEIAAMIPTGSPLPDQTEGYRSFVEWVRALHVAETGPGEFTVKVVVSSLGAQGGSEYRRLPIRAVEIGIRWTDGGWSVTDLPQDSELPDMAVAEPWPEGELPPEVEAAAIAAGGEGSVILGGGQVGGRWRVVVETVDTAGGRWPLVIWVDT